MNGSQLHRWLSQNIEKTKADADDYTLCNLFTNTSTASLLTMVRVIEVLLLSEWGLQGSPGDFWAMVNLSFMVWYWIVVWLLSHIQLFFVTPWTVVWASLVAPWQRFCLLCRSHSRRRFDPWAGKIPWRREGWQPTPVFFPGGSIDRGAWQGTVCRVEKGQTQLKRLNMHTQTVVHQVPLSVEFPRQEYWSG